MALNIILIVLGAGFAVYGVYLTITKKYSKKREEEYTKESLVKCAFVEGLSDIVVGLGVVLAGLGNNGNILPEFVYYTGFGIAIVALIADSVIESKVGVKLEKKEEPKEEEK